MKFLQSLALLIMATAVFFASINVYQHQKDIDDLKYKNYQLEKRIVQLETAY